MKKKSKQPSWWTKEHRDRVREMREMRQLCVNAPSEEDKIEKLQELPDSDLDVFEFMEKL